MPRLPRWTAKDAESELTRAGFELVRTKGSHRIYLKGNRRVVIPFHAGRELHPKIIKQVAEAISGED